ncbi:hypothetical protein K431DRAFT_169839 [Polychaeton citri CBS 116435]|uniref:Tudor domain-containing protein n=1 Tax=Polychaeton citri CBS 116435 TaxID=1314669 RepID=A0A9P4Q2H6_9PEZI|nr:hypothetical protein K431DRAFT_169839 [Polychaeton citri CBS 116435]
MGELEDSREALESFETLLALVDEHLASHPDDQEYLVERADTLANIDREKETIARLGAAAITAATSTSPPPSPPLPSVVDAPPPPPKYDMSKHPKFQKQAEEVPPPPPVPVEDAPVTFSVKDRVMAQWSEDRQWYYATVMSKTGSSANPVYTVKFRDYDTTEQRSQHQVRPFHAEKKRKAEESVEEPELQIPTAPITTIHNGTVISAEPAIDYSALQKKEPSKVSDGPSRSNPEPKKLKGKKALDRNQNSWLNFSKSGPKRKDGSSADGFKKKESMFRTPDLPNAKGT